MLALIAEVSNGSVVEIEEFRSPDYRKDFELGREEISRNQRPKCPFSHEKERLRRMAFFAGVNFQKGYEEGIEGRRRRYVQGYFASDWEDGYDAGLRDSWPHGPKLFKVGRVYVFPSA